MSNNDEFWDGLIMASSDVGIGDVHLPNLSETTMKGKEMGKGFFESVQSLTQAGAAKNALQLPIAAGSRVRFKANTGSLLTYENPPEPNAEGDVVTVRSASGNITSHDGLVFVQWKDRFMPIHAEHLEKVANQMRQGSPHRVRVACLGDLQDFLKVSQDTLVHKATKDLWSLRADGEGFVIERLFDTEGNALQV